MCTVTAFKSDIGWLITMNRDELRTRGDANPPFIWPTSNILAPQDSDAGGTWIGVNKNGVWACLLNGYLPDTENKITNPQTRGRIIPDILNASCPLSAIEKMDFSSTHAFRLWVGHDAGITEYFWDMTTLHHQEFLKDQWSFVSSSSLKQQEVLAFREKLFSDWKAKGAPILENGIPKIHLDNGPIDAKWDILMARDYSHTKSITQIEIADQEISMRHWDKDFSRSANHILAFNK